MLNIESHGIPLLLESVWGAGGSLMLQYERRSISNTLIGTKGNVLLPGRLLSALDGFFCLRQ